MKERKMADLVELQKQLNNIDELLALFLNVSDEKMPQLKNDINEIVKNIKDGFDKEELARQIRAVLNQAINEADYTKLKASIDATARKMIDAIESSSNKVEHWQDNYQLRSRWHYALISGAICFCIGFAAAVYWLKPSFEQQENILNRNTTALNTISTYVTNKTSNSAGTTANKPAKNVSKKIKPQPETDDSYDGVVNETVNSPN
jgi:ElaB/YqjD/DUF883 family membrane-anchored ribosome-binding protein